MTTILLFDIVYKLFEHSMQNYTCCPCLIEVVASEMAVVWEIERVISEKAF